MIERLLNRPFPEKIRLKKDIPFFIEYYQPYKDTPKVWTLRVGEEAEYFGHNDCYNFIARDGYVPYFLRVVLARLDEFIEVID